MPGGPRDFMGDGSACSLATSMRTSEPATWRVPRRPFPGRNGRENAIDLEAAPTKRTPLVNIYPIGQVLRCPIWESLHTMTSYG
jgi:hypothetical protein